MLSRNWILYELMIKDLVVHETVVRLRNRSLVATHDTVALMSCLKLYRIVKD